MSHKGFARLALIVGAVASFATCSDQQIVGPGARPEVSSLVETGYVDVKAIGPAGTYAFELRESVTTNAWRTDSFDVVAGSQTTAWQQSDSTSPSTNVTVAEVQVAGIKVDSVRVVVWQGAAIRSTDLYTETDSATAYNISNLTDVDFHFYNSVTTETGVTESPVDSLPSDILESYDAEFGAPDDVLFVLFRPGTTIQQKAAAVASIQGHVIGGHTVPNMGRFEGFYAVRFPSTGVGSSLVPKLAQLHANPVVYVATPITRSHIASRKPHDGSGWTQSQWRTSSDEADVSSARWALEQISAPLAWGCETGKTSVRIGVVDRSFNTKGELAKNVVDGPVYLTYPNDPVDSHGSSVASVIGAKGSDSVGMTGVMWDAGLRLREAGVYDDGIITQVANLIDEDVKIINISLVGTRNPSAHTVWSFQVAMSKVLREGEAAGHALPLIILSAGNVGTDAYNSVFPTLRDSFPNNVLVVAGSDRATTELGGSVPFWANSSTGNRIDIAAPAVGVGMLDEDGETVTTGNGTSLSAPLVTGVAGLLLSFDPRLQPFQLKFLIMQGAIAGGRTSGGHPFLDAYQALKLAGGLTGAPLCGTPIVQMGGTVSAWQGDLWTPLFNLPSNYSYPNPLHGGRTIDDSPFSRFTLASTAWVTDTPGDSYLLTGAVQNGENGYTHNRDTTTTTQVTSSDIRVGFRGANLGPSYFTKVMPFSSPPSLDSDSVCIRSQDNECQQYWVLQDGTQVIAHSALVPSRHELLLEATYRDWSYAVAEWESCGGSQICRNVTQEIVQDRSDLWHHDYHTTVWTKVSTSQFPFAIGSIAPSEDGFLYGLQRFTDKQVSQITWTSGPDGPQVSGSFAITGSSCMIEFRALRGTTPVTSRTASGPCHTHLASMGIGS
ncbi:MAG TPA: S8 family serine peptidase [Longimicrobiales bacterium]